MRCVFRISALLVAAAAAHADEQALQPTNPTREVVRAAGDWGTTRDTAARSVQTWNIDALRLEDGGLHGRIDVAGSSLFASANVEGTLSGRGVFGNLLDDDGTELATFEGAVTRGGANGTYRDRNGRTGEWQWTGQPKR
jgi:hypothetical protein